MMISDNKQSVTFLTVYCNIIFLFVDYYEMESYYCRYKKRDNIELSSLIRRRISRLYS